MYQIRIYITDASVLDDEALYDRARASVWTERRAETDRMLFRKDKNLSLGAGYLLMKACDDLGVDFNKLTLTTCANGKPCFEGNPLFFNISHSGERVVCAVGSCNVGCDTELIRERKHDIAERFFTEAECRLIEGDPEPKEMFYRLWTLKESFMKCTGLGLKLPLDEFEIRIDEPNRISVSQGVSDSEFGFAEYSCGDGYRYACCFEGSSEDSEVVWEQVEIKA